MDKTRTLPPSVRGKVTGVLNFFIDELRIFRNILLTNNFDLIVQIHWWGEVIPAHVRPEKFEVEDRICENTEKLDCSHHSTKYEIKTTWDLFKAYLGTCEVVELSVLESVENYVVGSAFLRDLVNLQNKNNEAITLPIVDYVGEQIGAVNIHVNLVEFPEEESSKVHHKVSTMLQNNNSVNNKPDKQFGSTSNTPQSNFLREKTIFYDGYFKKNLERDKELGLPFDRYNFKIKKKEISTPSLSGTETNSLYRNHETNSRNNLSENESNKNFPEVKTSSDSSKVLYFGVSSQQSRDKPSIKNPNLKLANKFNSNSIKFKSKPKSVCEIGSACSEKNFTIRNLPVRKSVSCKSLTKKKSETTVEDKGLESASLFQQTVRQIKDRASSISSRSETISSHQTDLSSTPLKDSSNVLDYLLGSSMSKEDEKIALNDFKQMSPSHNLVKTISQLCLLPDHGTQNPDPKGGTGPDNRTESDTSHQQQPSLSGPVKKTHLTFDFENPIERTYYEKFFLKSDSPGGFEIAELLNQPENRFVLGTSDKTGDLLNPSETGSLKSCSKYSNNEREVLEDDDYLASIGGPDRKKSCARCKYYKKLDELDIIIESLKHFEEKMISHEKNIQAGLRDRLDMGVRKTSQKTITSPVI